MTATATASVVRDVEELAAGMRALESSSRFSPELLDQVGDMAYNLLEQGRIEDAYLYYSFLTTYRPTGARFLIGQGVCAREMGRSAEACLLFDLAACVEPEEPAVSLLSAECQLLMGQTAEARETLELVERFCAGRPEHEEVGARARALRELIADAQTPARQ